MQQRRLRILAPETRIAGNIWNNLSPDSVLGTVSGLFSYYPLRSDSDSSLASSSIIPRASSSPNSRSLLSLTLPRTRPIQPHPMIQGVWYILTFNGPPLQRPPPRWLLHTSTVPRAIQPRTSRNTNACTIAVRERLSCSCSLLS